MPDPKKKLGEKLVKVADGLSTLRVRTCVGKIHAKTPQGDAGGTKFELDWTPAETRVIATEINLVAGDADNFIHEDFLGDGAGAEMRQFHERQVSRAQDIVQRNVDLMVKLGTKLIGELKELI